MYTSSLGLTGYFFLFALSANIPKFLEFSNYEVLSFQEEILSHNPHVRVLAVSSENHWNFQKQQMEEKKMNSDL